MSDETKIFTKNDKNGDKCASGGQESGLKLIFEQGVAILVRPWRFPGQPKKFVFFSIKVGTINSGTSLDSREQFKKTGKLEFTIKSQFQKYWLSRVNHLFFRASKPFRHTNPDFFTKNGKKSNFGPFSSSPVNAGCSRYPVVYVSLISSIQAC